MPQGVARPPERAAVTHCLRGTAMLRRGRPAQGHAPAEGLAQNGMVPLFVADVERRTQALGATRMVVERLVDDPLMDSGVS